MWSEFSVCKLAPDSANILNPAGSVGVGVCVVVGVGLTDNVLVGVGVGVELVVGVGVGQLDGYWT